MTPDQCVCIQCGAPRGEPCLTAGGKPMNGRHHHLRVLTSCLPANHEAAIRRLGALLDRAPKKDKPDADQA